MTRYSKTSKTASPYFLPRMANRATFILDIEEYEKINATLRLMSELEKGERSAREKGWIDFTEIEREFASNIPD